MRLIVSCLLCRQQEHAGLNSTESMTRALISDDNIARQSALGPVQLGYVPPYSPPSDNNTSSRISHQHHHTTHIIFSSQILYIQHIFCQLASNCLSDDLSHRRRSSSECHAELCAFEELWCRFIDYAAWCWIVQSAFSWWSMAGSSSCIIHVQLHSENSFHYVTLNQLSIQLLWAF